MAKMTHSVVDFFDGKSVLITGATGFLGKALVEKLLRSCPGLVTAYILIRPTSRNLHVHDRFAKLLESSVFNCLREHNPTALRKITAISGDITLPGLGLTNSDVKLLVSTVSVVIHCAATVKFHEELLQSAKLNVSGLKELLNLCKKMKNLQAFVHTSTAYANCHQTVIEEKIYPPPEGTKKLMKYLNDHESRDDKHFDDAYFSKVVKECRPNTYTYTKSVAEYVLSEEAENLPICIVRPSIVAASLNEPVPGWVDNVNGCNGIAVGFGLGVLRVLKAHSGHNLNIVPVDMVANMILCAAWATSLGNYCVDTHKSGIKVYNFCAPPHLTMVFKTFAKIGGKMFGRACPLSKAAFYPGLTLTTNNYAHCVIDFLFQYVPAAAVSIFYKMNYNPIRMYRKMKRQLKALEFFTKNEFTFTTNNVDALHNRLSTHDRQVFPFRVICIDWEEHIRNYCFGIRRFVMKEDDSTISNAQKRMSRLYIWTLSYKSFLLVCAILTLIAGFKISSNTMI